MAPRNSSGSLGWKGFPGDGDGRGPSLCPAGPNLGLLMNHISLMEVTAVFPCLGLCLSMIPTPAMGWCSGRSTNSLSGHITPEHSSCPKMLSPPFKTQTSLGIRKKNYKYFGYQPGKCLKYSTQRCCGHRAMPKHQQAARTCWSSPQ